VALEAVCSRRCFVRGFLYIDTRLMEHHPEVGPMFLEYPRQSCHEGYAFKIDWSEHTLSCLAAIGSSGCQNLRLWPYLALFLLHSDTYRLETHCLTGKKSLLVEVFIVSHVSETGYRFSR
jgi:hypothetical protein